jgi:hypothetical protein
MYSTYCRGLLQGYDSEFQSIPYDWEALTKTVLEAGTYLQFCTWWQDEVRQMAC